MTTARKILSFYSLTVINTYVINPALIGTNLDTFIKK